MPELPTLPRRGLNPRQIETVERLYDAARELLDEHGYADLTVRLVAARAGVSPATAYTYFASKDHLCAALYWRTLVQAPDVKVAGSRLERVQQVVRQSAELLAGSPPLAVAASRSLLGQEPEVQELRLAIGEHWARRLRTALGEDASPELLEVLLFAFTGALLQAGMGVVDYESLADRLSEAVALVLRGNV